MIEKLKILQEQFQAATSRFGGMTYLVVCCKDSSKSYPSNSYFDVNIHKREDGTLFVKDTKWHKGKQLTKRQKAKRVKDALQRAIDARVEVEPEYNPTDARRISYWLSDSTRNWLLSPTGVVWNKAQALCTLETLAESMVRYFIDEKDSPIISSIFSEKGLEIIGNSFDRNYIQGWLLVLRYLRPVINKVYDSERDSRRIAENGEPCYSVIDNVFLESALALGGIAARIKGLPAKLQTEATTLKNFLKVVCDIDNPDRCESIQTALRRADVKMPHVGNWRQGQSKYFDPAMLFYNWEDWQKIVPILPSFKYKK